MGHGGGSPRLMSGDHMGSQGTLMMSRLKSSKECQTVPSSEHDLCRRVFTIDDFASVLPRAVVEVACP